MARYNNGPICIFLLVLLIASTVSAVPFRSGGPSDDEIGGYMDISNDRGASSSRDGSRAVLISRLTGTPPTIDGSFTLASEWSEAQETSVGNGGNVVELYMAGDGVNLYVLVDAVSDTDLDPEPPPPNNEWIVMVWDGDNDGKISFQQGAQGSKSYSNGGQNVDFGVLLWGDGTIWDSEVVMSGNSVIFNTGSSNNAVISDGFATTPNSATPHRVLEYMIPYDGTLDQLGCSGGYPFTKGFNIQVIENASGTQDIIGQWPTTFTSISTSFDTANLPQKFPHIQNIVSPTEGAVFQQGHDIKFEMDATDNNMSTLTRTLYLDNTPYSMSSNILTKNDIGVGEYTVRYNITDDEGFSDEKELGIIKVAEEATPPVITSVDPSQNDVTINEGDEYNFTIDWYDLNLDQSNESVIIKWDIDGQPADLAWMSKVSINVTHQISTLTFKSDYSGDFDKGIYVINFELTDRYFDTYTSVIEDWTLTVNNVDRGPVIFNTEPQTDQVITITETTTQQFTIETRDDDLDPVSINWFEDGVKNKDYTDKSTFVFNDGAPDYDKAGNYVVKVVISDGELSAQAQWDVSVNNVNRVPEFDPTQMVPDSDEIEINEGDTLPFSYKATDPDGDLLNYTWSINDVTEDSGTGQGTFSFETAFLKANGLDSSDSPYYVQLEVDDGDLTVEHEWKVIVINVNRPPIPIIDMPKEGDSFKVGVPVMFKTTASYDPDGEKLTYSWDFGDKKTAGGPDLNHDYTTNGRYRIVLTVNDGHGDVKTEVNITIAIAILRLDVLDYEPKAVKEGDVVNIKIDISNIGDASAANVKVKFYVGKVTQAGFVGEKVIPSIDVDSTQEANISWLAEAGNQALYAVLEKENSYQIQGRNDKNLVVSVKAKPAPVGNGDILAGNLLPLLLIVVIIVIVVALITASSRKKRRLNLEEDAKIKAIIDSKHAPPPRHKRPTLAASPYDRTDFQFGPVVGVEKACEKCGRITVNASGMCDDCTHEKRMREEADKFMECPVCGNEIAKDMFTCPYCHFNFSKLDMEEEEEEVHESVGYVSDDACSDCGVLFNDGIKVIKCPSCEATYHKRCRDRLGTCFECNADLSAGLTKTFHQEEEPPKEPESIIRPEPEPIKEQGPKCPSCNEDIEDDWKVCPTCDHDLGAAEKTLVVPVDEIVAEPVVVAPSGPVERRCPNCNEETESDWKVCPSCDTRLDGAAAPLPKKKVKTPPSPKKPEPVVKEEKTVAPSGKCPNCNEEVESDWKVCPNCDHRLIEEETKKKGRKRIKWSKKAKERAQGIKHPQRLSTTKSPSKKKEEPKGQNLQADLDSLKKDIEKAEKDGKNVKKAKSLATLAGSFLKGKKADKAKIYIERSLKELEK